MKMALLLAALSTLTFGLTATIQVAAVTSPDQWTLGAGANKVVAVNGPDDDNASYITLTGPPSSMLWEMYGLAANGIPAGATINSVVVHNRGLISVDHSWAAYLRLGANLAAGSGHWPGNYVSYDETIGRPGGGTWTKSDIDILEVGVRDLTSDAGSCRITSLWVVVDYTPPPSSGFLLMFP